MPTLTEFVRGKGPGNTFQIDRSQISQIQPRTNTDERGSHSLGATITKKDGSVVFVCESVPALIEMDPAFEAFTVPQRPDKYRPVPDAPAIEDVEVPATPDA